ncbi:nuclear transport factor 2 family protein [Streptomyces spiralis]
MDLGDPGSVAELFTRDGVRECPPPGDGRRVQGRDAPRACFDSRPADRLSRRLTSNIVVTVPSPDTATAVSCFTTYRVDGHRGGMGPAGPPVHIGHHEDRFRRVSGAWLLPPGPCTCPSGPDTRGPRAGTGPVE